MTVKYTVALTSFSSEKVLLSFLSKTHKTV